MHRATTAAWVCSCLRQHVMTSTGAVATLHHAVTVWVWVSRRRRVLCGVWPACLIPGSVSVQYSNCGRGSLTSALASDQGPMRVPAGPDTYPSLSGQVLGESNSPESQPSIPVTFLFQSGFWGQAVRLCGLFL
jgi:hypothetical protein